MNAEFMQIKKVAESLEEELIQTRRHVHENPELGFKEYETAKFIAAKLDEMGIEYQAGIAKTGIVATIKGSGEGKTLLIRADMDALPLEEKTDLPFKSKNEGVFHACGHDAHVACLLGAAKILNENREKFKGTVKLVFQPAEEGSLEYDPTGKIAGGALPMILEGAFGDPDNPSIDAALALHIVAHPERDALVGHIGVKDGAFTGSADEIYIDIEGVGGHGSAPHTAVDPIYIASQFYIAAQGFISRRVDPMEPVVFTIGKINAGFRQNIIPNTCRIEATLRTQNEEIRSFLKEELPKLAKSIAQAFGGDAKTSIITGYPVGYNDPEMNKHIRKVTEEMYGPEAVVDVEAVLGAEDFYEFGFKNKIPIAMFWLGGGNVEENKIAANHSELFDFDEKALPMGTAILAATAISYLNDH